MRNFPENPKLAAPDLGERRKFAGVGIPATAEKVTFGRTKTEREGDKGEVEMVQKHTTRTMQRSV